LIYNNVSVVAAVPSENKRDQRTIEQVMADNRARKKQKTEPHETNETATLHQQHTDDAVQ